ncbi:Nitrate reductase [Pseudomonas syringae pv. cilantro]|uniref:Nitrate reductase n=2 Tax=Pseudomonas syringae group TaxID=136849 RepID=A0A0N0X8N0_PSESX|nr:MULTISPECIES: nitrate reductase [Pseudomonas syringae group]KPC27001.1 Nitrate reductase [Pseudomonas syringae pv. cilantro]KPW76715.1 Nitrate reductase [Pseudomonas syringae pv. coriandricola]RMN07881.1 Nitrate reductase [Pseudomonas syringae pv. coriandricola]
MTSLAINPTQVTASTCCYCGVGCGVLIEHDGQSILGVSGDPTHPANFGKLCSKGSSLNLTGDVEARALYPELRLSKGLARSVTDWDTALEHAANVFAESIREHGPDSVAFYISGQLLTEDYYAFNKLARALVGTNNIDSNSRLCMSSAVAGYKRSLGADAPPCNYQDIELSDCVLIVGSNMAYAHPVLFRRLEEAKSRRPQMKIIVIDPRRTDTCELADLHLDIQPGTDVALFHGLLHLLIRDKLVDPDFIAAHTQGYAELCALADNYPPEYVATLCGISAQQLHTCARWIGESPSFLSLWCMGLNQSSAGSAKNSALINLHLATGQIGHPGAGPFSLTGQPNAMGGRETGSLSNLLPGHRDAGNAEHRAEVADYWGVDSLPANPGLSAIELFEQLQRGTIKALWIACTNPAQSLPDQNRVRQALETCPFVVLQEAFKTTETARFADLLLPAASWGEKEGTVTNSERRISNVRKAIAAPGEARADWAITVDFAQRLQKRLQPEVPALFDFQTPEALFDEFKGLTAGRDLDMAGIDRALIDRQGPQQWPFPVGATAGTPRLYADAVFPTASGRAQFLCEAYVPARELRDTEYPITLNTGRLRDQWHGMSRTGTAARLFGHVNEAVLSLDPQEMQRHDLQSGDLVRLISRRGALFLPVSSDDSIAPGQAFLPMHWGDRFLKGGVNSLTQPAFDPVSKQPELKHSGVRIEKAHLPWQFFALIEGDVQQRMEKLRPLCDAFDYLSMNLSGRERSALIINAASTQAPEPQLLRDIDRLLGLDGGPVMAYDDPARSIGKRVRIDDGRITAVRLAGETVARHWLHALWQAEHFDASLRRWLLAPLSSEPGKASAQNRDKTLCNCMNVSQRAVMSGVERGLDLNQLKTQLGCGTQCGSCVPEIKRLINTVAVT